MKRKISGTTESAEIATTTETKRQS